MFILDCTGVSGTGSCCTSSYPCKLGGGDCDKDDDCEGSLVCGIDNCQDFNPAAGSNYDCCIEPGILYAQYGQICDIFFIFLPQVCFI